MPRTNPQPSAGVEWTKQAADDARREYIARHRAAADANAAADAATGGGRILVADVTRAADGTVTSTERYGLPSEWWADHDQAMTGYTDVFRSRCDHAQPCNQPGTVAP